MANDAYIAASSCQRYEVHGTRVRHQKKLYLFPATGPLEYVAMDIPGPSTNTKYGKQHEIVLTNFF